MPKPAAVFGIETPLPLQPTANYFQVLGWALFPSASRPTQVRVRVGEQLFPAVEVFERSDVATSYPDSPHALQSGFKILGYLSFGAYTGTLEASPDGGKDWHPLRTLTITISAHPLCGELQVPQESNTITSPVRVGGWCLHPEFQIASVVLQYGNVTVTCDYDLPRSDVPSRFPDLPQAARCGFISSENLPRGRGRLKLRAHTTCGRVFFLESDLLVDLQTGHFPHPPPPSPVADLSSLALDVLTHDVPASGDVASVSPDAPGERNLLFVLYGDFTSNSALHVANLANELGELGYDCVVAVRSDKATVGALPRSTFMAVEYREIDHLTAYFKDGRGPRWIHAWTPREPVRLFCERVLQRFAASCIVHLEDNEFELLEHTAGMPFPSLASSPDAQLAEILPSHLMHPRLGPGFLQQAQASTVIVDALREHTNPDRPCHLIRPAASSGHFRPHPRADDRRAALGIGDNEIVLFYHGNVHEVNESEVLELYEATAQLNETGLRTLLLRTGRDHARFTANQDPRFRPHLIHLGHVKRARHLPPLMAMADFFVQPGSPGAFNDYRFPSKLPEFFAIGRPVVLPAANLALELQHGTEAWVVPQADAASIADSIRTIVLDSALRSRLAKGALAVSQRLFSWSRSAKQLAEFYESLPKKTTTSV